MYGDNKLITNIKLFKIAKLVIQQTDQIVE